MPAPFFSNKRRGGAIRFRPLGWTCPAPPYERVTLGRFVQTPELIGLLPVL
jgi:hypothetical protein